MARTKPAAAVACGRYCYLFKSKTNSSDCMISAHGGFVAENRSFTVPQGVEVIFYGTHGAALQDPNISSFAPNLSKAIPVEVAPGGQSCRNYLLSKYQGAHAGASGTEVVETYDQIAGAIASRDRVRQAKFDKMLKTPGGVVSTEDKVFTDLMENWGGSILTIRNRWDVLTGVPLSEAIKAARKEMPSLRAFHCIFCRCTMLPDKMAHRLGQTQKPSVEVAYR